MCLRPKTKSFTSNELPTSGRLVATVIPIVSIEDGMDENDWDGWAELTEKWGRKSSSWATTCL